MRPGGSAPLTVDEYIAGFPPSTRAVLRRVRAAIRKALPGAEEVISYRMPAYRQHGYVVIYFAGWKQHYSIYPAGARLVAAFRKDLAPYEVNNKGTIRFPLDAPVPTALLGGLAAFMAKEAEARRARTAAAKRR